MMARSRVTISRVVLHAVVACGALALGSVAAYADAVKDLKYGAVLFEFYQQKYFETLVEYEYAAERGGIHAHGDYPELLKGGVSLSYGLDLQAKDIFSKLIAEHSPEEIQNRAWFFLAKMLYLRGDIERSAGALASISGALPGNIDQEYRYLAALVNIKLGHFAQAEAISRRFARDSAYAPYLHFNLGVALGKQNDHSGAITQLTKAAAYANGSRQLDSLADRANMAMAYLHADKGDFSSAYSQIRHVSATGVYSNRALLGSGWASVNEGAYREALAPLTALQGRSMAIPEVQEAVLLVPHVYEKLDLMGRAAEGFISAYERYGQALDELDNARAVLKDADVLELFVRNLDQILGESDWFGRAPSVSLNKLSPFLLELMADHSFQSVLKDLRDLYAIRNNLEGWKRKRDDFEVILEVRESARHVDKRGAVSVRAEDQMKLEADYQRLKLRAAALGEEDRRRVQWLLDDIQFELGAAAAMLGQLADAGVMLRDTESYASRFEANMEVLEGARKRTDEMIAKVEQVLIGLVMAELEVHEQRLEYYRIQSHLAKVRILDRSLSERDGPAANEVPEEPSTLQSPNLPGRRTQDSQGGNNAA